MQPLVDKLKVVPSVSPEGVAPLPETRKILYELTPKRCGMEHHWSWAHGCELPRCAYEVRNAALDCAHSENARFHVAIDRLTREGILGQEQSEQLKRFLAIDELALTLVDEALVDLAPLLEQRSHGARTILEAGQRLMQNEGIAGDFRGIDPSEFETHFLAAQKDAAAGRMLLRKVLLRAFDVLIERPSEEGAALAKRCLAVFIEKFGDRDPLSPTGFLTTP